MGKREGKKVGKYYLKNCKIVKIKMEEVHLNIIILISSSSSLSI